MKIHDEFFERFVDPETNKEIINCSKKIISIINETSPGKDFLTMFQLSIGSLIITTTSLALQFSEHDQRRYNDLCDFINLQCKEFYHELGQEDLKK